MDLKAARERLGMTQAELAREFGYVQTAIANWETGYRAIPRYAEVMVRALELKLELEKKGKGEGK